MAIFSESRLVGLSNADLLKFVGKNPEGGNPLAENGLATGLMPVAGAPEVDGSQVEGRQDAIQAQVAATEETGGELEAAEVKNPQAELAEALQDAGAHGLTAKEIADVGVTKDEAAEALENIDDAEEVSFDPAIADIQLGARKSIFASIGEFFSDTWAKLKRLMGR